MNKLRYLTIISIFSLILSPNQVFAQDITTDPIYIVQPGENLSIIADKFGLDVDDLISVNNINDSNLISTGTELIIPGLENVSGYLSVTPIGLGDTIPILLRVYKLDLNTFLKLNSLTSPSEAYVGSNLILPVSAIEENNSTMNSFSLKENISILIKGLESNRNPWLIHLENKLDQHSIQIPGELFITSGTTNNTGESFLSPNIQDIELYPLPISQGHTVAIKVKHSAPVEMQGEFDGHAINFYEDSSGQTQYAIDGINALRDPGLAELSLSASFESGSTWKLDQMVLIESGGYVNEELTVESTLIDQELNNSESDQVQAILATSSDQKYWSGPFRYPVDGSLENETIGFSSYFGNRRSYNNGEYFGFHGGLDFYILLNTFNIYATAPGIVLFAGPMNIRGMTTFIDHGQGVVSGYAHQSEIQVEEGQFVDQGDLIGQIGQTGRVTGPHLHWDIWINGNQVDPFDWIYNEYP